ncbi:RDD family protein [Glutamicibacter sp. NPDC090743]|uniref:RDD family protein n=1 Tax=Glutamicibacter sp. NPDC090743 TaxID=3364001 RepID=UPI003827D4A3
MAVKMDLVDARTTQRLLSWLVDFLPVLVLSVIFLPMIASRMVNSLNAPQIMGEIAGTYILYSVLTLACTVFLWWWEAAAGKSLGNVLLGLRTTTVSGERPGWGKTIIRRLLIAVAGIVPILGSVLMVISNQFDANGKKQGWHDKAAGTLVLDIKAGRDPLTTGGTGGPGSFAPQQQYAPGRRFVGEPEEVPGKPSGVIDSVPGAVRNNAPEARPRPAAQPKPEAKIVEVRSSKADADPDADHGHTQIRSQSPDALHLLFDDSRCLDLAGSILIGRNPSYADGDVGVHLVAVDDPERTVSKTHLLIQPGVGSVWVTDRDSGNGSSIVDEDGNVRELVPGKPEQAMIGHTVYFGDRYFQVERP